MQIDVKNLQYLFTLRYNPYSKKYYKVITDIPEDVKEIDLALSSGIDSHYVLQTIAEARPDLNINCICVDFEDGPKEKHDAACIARRYDNVNNFIACTIEDPLEDLEKWIKVVGEPRWNLYQHFVYERCKSGIIVTGDGGDEVFGGYVFRYKKFLSSNTVYYLDCHERDWVSDQYDLFTSRFSWSDFILEFNKVNTLNDVILADYYGKLQHDFLPNCIKIAKSLGVKLITPLMRSMPKSWEYLYDTKKNLGKLPLRKALNRWDDGKLGFGFDTVKYWNRLGKDKIKPLLDNPKSAIYEHINWDWYQKHKDIQDVRYVNKFLHMYALELYLKL